jgi:hypothetical protein
MHAPCRLFVRSGPAPHRTPRAARRLARPSPADRRGRCAADSRTRRSGLDQPDGRLGIGLDQSAAAIAAPGPEAGRGPTLPGMIYITAMPSGR